MDFINYTDYQFTHPEFLKLFYVIPIFWLIALIGIKKLPIWRLLLSSIFRSVVFGVIVLVLAGLSKVEKDLKDLEVIYLVDRSNSIDDDGKAWIDKYVQNLDSKLPEDVKRELSVFGLNTKLAYDMEKLPDAGDLSKDIDLADLNVDRTNIENAIVSNIGRFDSSAAKRIVLVSDGNENAGNVLKAAMLAMNADVEIFTAAPPKSIFEEKISLKKVLAPAEIPVGKTGEIKIIVENKSDSYIKGHIDLFIRRPENEDNPVLFKKWDKKIAPGLNVFKTKYIPSKKGFTKFETILKSDEKINIEENRKVNAVIVTGKSKILYVNGVKGRKLFLPNTLSERDLTVDVVSPDKIPTTVLDMLEYDSVIFSNVSRAMFSRDRMKTIERYVRDFGGGFVMLGGENSFIQGGYINTPIEKILPVKMEGGEHKRKEKKYRFSLMMVMDKSASMGGKKMTFAKKAALELVKQLKDNDKLGIVAFDNNPYLITALRPIPAVKVDLISKLSRLSPGGGTNIFPALKMAYIGIVNSKAKKNHVILLSDGNSEFLYYNKEALLRAYKESKISISTIAIGKWFVNTNLLKEIARRTGGSFYRVADVVELPRLIIKDAEDSISQTDIHEEFFYPKKIKDSKILRNISEEQLPPLKGFSITTPKSGAETPLVTTIRGKNDPILSNWRYGLGKTLVYTADAEARWSSDWIKWIKYNKFWSQALRWTMRDTPASDYSLKVDKIDGKPYLIIESFFKEEQIGATTTKSTGKITPSDMKVLLYKNSPDGKSTILADSKPQELLLRQIGPTSYMSSIENLKPGNYFTNVLFMKSDKVLSNKVKGLIIPQFKAATTFSDSGEHYNNVELLRKVSEITSGKYNPEIKDITKNEDEVLNLINLAKYLIPIALLAFMFDIALRKR